MTEGPWGGGGGGCGGRGCGTMRTQTSNDDIAEEK